MHSANPHHNKDKLMQVTLLLGGKKLETRGTRMLFGWHQTAFLKAFTKDLTLERNKGAY